MEIRCSEYWDIPQMMEIYAHARSFMAAHGNPRQWGRRSWPPEALIRQDISQGKSYVCTQDGEILGTFFYDRGFRAEPAYDTIENGAWLGDDTYGVVHRIASSGSCPGVGKFCISWAYCQCGHLRMDTHGDNKVMQNLLSSLGFVQCGRIYVPEDDDPRIAYEKL